MTVNRKIKSRRIRHLVQNETALKSIGDIRPGMELFGLTNGQFSVINILDELLKQTGPAKLDVTTWTIASAEISLIDQWVKAGRVTELRFLLDRSFSNRKKEYYAEMLQTFTDSQMRIARIHGKFAVISTDHYDLAIRSSMNLNENKRVEFFEISDDKILSGYLASIFDNYYSRPFTRMGYVIEAAGYQEAEAQPDPFAQPDFDMTPNFTF